MNKNKLKHQWQKEQEHTFKGWDFSYIDGRWENENLPWDYSEIVKKHLKITDNILDMGTGGGEFLLSLKHPYKQTWVTEAYPPNVELCNKTLSPLGITVAQTYDDNKLPFKADTFDIIINRHESFDIYEVNRVLKSGGYFITQQVGCTNNNDLSAKLINDFVPQFKEHKLERYLSIIADLKLTVEKAEEFFPEIKFFDVGALVYFAKIIPWEFPNFTVESCFDNLYKCQNEMESNGYVKGTEHRFILVVRKS